MPTGTWLSSVVGRRAVFDEVTKLVENELQAETPGEIRQALRGKALSKSTLGAIPAELTLAQELKPTEGSKPERFLDTEIVAIYW